MLLLLTILLCAPASASEPADRVLAVVEDELVLASEVPLSQALTAHDPDAGPFWTREARDETSRLVEAAAIRAAAGELELYRPSALDISERLQRVRSTFRDRASADTFFARWGLSEADQQAWAEERLTVERYLRRNLRSEVGSGPWNAELDALLDTLRRTTRIRRIEEQP